MHPYKKKEKEEKGKKKKRKFIRTRAKNF